MNFMQFNKAKVPLTPNLEEYKRKNKSMSRRKLNSILPTNPPTPKIFKAQVTLKPTQDKHNESQEHIICCQEHPDRQATYISNIPSKCRYCTTCYLLRNQNEQNEQLIEEEKKNELQGFQRKIIDFSLKLQGRGKYTLNQIVHREQNFNKQLSYIEVSFQKMRQDFDEKERELKDNLVSAQQLIMESLLSHQSDIQEMQKAIERYVKEISNNYDDIVESLPFQKFVEIIQQYHQKIKYFQSKVQGFSFQSTLNVYIPKKQFSKILERANVQSYYSQSSQQTFAQNHNLERYSTEKHPLFNQRKNPNYTSYNQGPLSSIKINLQRHSRDLDCHLNTCIQSNKQNSKFDNRSYH